MPRILVVEDDRDKRQKISQVLAQVEGLEISAITHVSDVYSAKRELRSVTFDVMILDICLPLLADQLPTPDAGVILLEELMERPGSYRVPGHIIGITAYGDILSRASGQFSRRLLTLVYYEADRSEWSEALIARMRQIVESESARALASPAYKSALAIVCGLHDPELSTVLRYVPWNWSATSLPDDHMLYWHGTYECSGIRQTVHAAASAYMGMPMAAVMAAKMVHSFRPRYLAMTGIAAGIQGRVQLGDIIVADPSWDWGSGKWTLEDGQPKFHPAPRQLPLDVSVRERLRALGNDEALLEQICRDWPGELPPGPLRMHVGPLASGAAVLADRYTARRVIEQQRQLLGIDMEVYGLCAVAEEAGDPRPTAIAIKSVVDFADGDKNDRYQGYGAFTSAQMLRHLAEGHLSL